MLRVATFWRYYEFKVRLLYLKFVRNLIFLHYIFLQIHISIADLFYTEKTQFYKSHPGKLVIQQVVTFYM